MFLPAPAVKALANYLVEFLEPDLLEGGFDPNDFIILEQFVLPDLQDNLETGVDTDELLEKGWMITACLIPDLLNEDLPPAVYGALARAMQLHFLERAKTYIGYVDDAYYAENQQAINRYIKDALPSTWTNPEQGSQQ